MSHQVSQTHNCVRSLMESQTHKVSINAWCDVSLMESQTHKLSINAWCDVTYTILRNKNNVMLKEKCKI